MKNYEEMTREELIKTLKELSSRENIKQSANEHTLHELEKHQIEVETQNIELQESLINLDESRDRYAFLYDFAPVGYCTLDEKGIIKEINLTGATMLGVERDRLPDMPFRMFVSEGDMEKFFRHLKKCKEHMEKVSTELCLKEKNGQMTWIELLSSPLQASGELMFQAVIIDITERKRVEEALRESEGKYRALVETTDTGYLILDREGRVVDANLEYVRLTGHRELREILGKSVVEWTAEHAKSSNARAVAQCAKDGRIRDFATDYVDGNGRITPIELNATVEGYGEALRIISLCRDITERKRAEEMLRESEKRYRTLFETSHDAIMTLEPPLWKFTTGNPATIKMFRAKNEEEFISCEPWKLSPVRQPDGRFSEEKAKEIIETVMREGYHFFEWTHKRLDEEEFPATVLLTRVEYSGKQFLQATVRDITEQKRAEDALQLFNNLMDQSNDAVFVIDPKTSRFMEINEKACVSLGYTRDQLLSMGVIDIEAILPDDLSWEAHIKKVREAGSMLVNGVHKRKDGSSFPVEVNVKLVRYGNQEHMVSIARDITERKQAEEELRRSEERFRAIFDHANDGILVADIASKKFVMANAVMCNMLGYSSEELRELGVDRIHPPDRLEEVLNAFESQARREILLTDNLPVMRKDGSVFYADINSSPVTIGKQLYLIGIFRDITERKKAEEERQKLQGQLIHAQRMESVGRLAGGVAHGFNNILGIILGYVEMALYEVAPTNPIIVKLEAIRKATKRAADLTRQLLTFASKQIVAPRVLDLNETVDGMLKMLQQLIGEDINIVWKPASDLYPVKMDSTQIDQILVNLSLNARDAIAGVGKITIETNNAVFDEGYCVTHPESMPGWYVMLAISDNGCGMDKETLANIFEPFFTTKELYKGAGLGMATVYGIVRQNNGFISAYSAPGIGTTFKIYLPRYADKIALDSANGPENNA